MCLLQLFGWSTQATAISLQQSALHSGRSDPGCAQHGCLWRVHPGIRDLSRPFLSSHKAMQISVAALAPNLYQRCVLMKQGASSDHWRAMPQCICWPSEPYILEQSSLKTKLNPPWGGNRFYFSEDLLLRNVLSFCCNTHWKECSYLHSVCVYLLTASSHQNGRWRPGTDV